MRPRAPALLTALATAATLAACADPPPPPPPVSPTAAIDGTYGGPASGSCGVAHAVAVVNSGHFTLTLDDRPSLDGIAQADGSLRAAKFGDDGRELNFTGHIEGADLRGGSYNGQCAFAFALTRKL